MTTTGTLQVTTPTDREIVMTRRFDAPRTLVFEAFTKPDLVRQWLLGPPGWSMPVCKIDLRVGGTYRYEWRQDSDGTTMGMGGVYREVVAPQRLVCTERFDDAWYPGEGLGTLVLVEQGGKTTATQTMLYESRAARDAAIKTGMEKGVAASYDRLEGMLVPPRPRRPLRSIAAVLAGFAAVVVLSLGTDQVLHSLKVYPPWGQAMADGLFVLATAYRILYTIVGGYITARLAPHAPVRHAVILGLVGLVPGGAGVMVAIAKPELGPLWYSIVIAVTGVPCAWLGGVLHRMKHVSVVRWPSRRGDEFLRVDLQEFQGRAGEPLRRRRAGAQGKCHVRDLPARRPGFLRPERRAAIQVHAGDFAVREL